MIIVLDEEEASNINRRWLFDAHVVLVVRTDGWIRVMKHVTADHLIKKELDIRNKVKEVLTRDEVIKLILE